jgi:hypothetical protein
MTEESRKALAELLLLAPYLDKHLSLDEDEMLESALKAIGWDPGNPGNISLPAAFALVREAGSDETKTFEFMRERAAIVKSAGDSDLAYEWLIRILGSDGTSVEETRFLSQIKPMLYS